MKRAAVDLFGEIVEPDEDDVSSDRRCMSESTIKGRYAEFMVCAYLTKMSLNVVHLDTVGFDLIVEFDGHSYRVDVKSGGLRFQGPFKESVRWKVEKSYWSEGETIRRRRKLTPDDADLLALFYAPLETVVFYPVLKPVGQVRLPMSVVRNAGKGEATLRIAIEKLARRQAGGDSQASLRTTPAIQRAGGG